MAYEIKFVPQAVDDLKSANLSAALLEEFDKNLDRLAIDPTMLSELAGYQYPKGQLFRFKMFQSDMKTIVVKILFCYGTDETTIWILRVWVAQPLWIL